MSFYKYLFEKMALHKSSVVGGVVIPHCVVIPAAATGLGWCSFYGYSNMLTSKFGVKPPERAMRFMTGSAMLMAGSVALGVYDFNKVLARVIDMDKEELELELAKMRKMSAGKIPKPFALFAIATSMFMVGGLYANTKHLKTVIDNEVEKVSVSD